VGSVAALKNSRFSVKSQLSKESLLPLRPTLLPKSLFSPTSLIELTHALPSTSLACNGPLLQPNEGRRSASII
jgi:hypothetical protein